jgi:AcrR family transcriptional regulator
VAHDGEDAPRRRRRGTARRPRLDPAAAKAELLGAGVDLVHEQALGETLGHLRITDLAKAAGLSSGAFYHYWDGQDAYRDEVLRALLAGDRDDADPSLFLAVVDDDPVEQLRRVAVRWSEALDDVDHRVELALWAHGDPRTRPDLRRRARRSDAARAAALGRLLAATGRAPAAGWDLPTLATASVLLGDGLRTQALMDPSRLVSLDDGGRPWPVAGVLGLLLVLGATEPGEPVDVPAGLPPAEVDAADDDAPRRRRLVELGVAAIREQPAGNALDHIRAEDVVARLGLTIGAFYHYWDSQDDYRDDLVDALFDADRYMDPTAGEGPEAEAGSAATLDEGARLATNYYWSVAAGHPANEAQLGFHAIDDPYLASRLGAETRALQAPWAEVLGALLARHDRAVRPPLDEQLVVLGMGAALDGTIVRFGLDPEGLGPDEEGWTRWGRLCAALVRAATGPRDDDRDVFTAARDLLGG